MTQYYMSNPQRLIGHSNKRSPRELVTYPEKYPENTTARNKAGCDQNEKNKVSRKDGNEFVMLF